MIEKVGQVLCSAFFNVRSIPYLSSFSFAIPSIFYTFATAYKIILIMIVEPKVIEEFAAGSHSAFCEIFRVSYSKVYAFIRGFIKDTDDAKDVAQIVFIKLWDKRSAFLQVRHFDSYLFTLTKYTVFNYIAAKNIVPTVNGEELPEETNESTPYEELVAKDLQLLIDMVVENMPAQRKLVYRLSRVNGLSNDRIAEKLGLQKKTVENHLNLALKELKDILSLFVYIYLMLMD